MPVLAAHIGSSQISFLYYASPLSYKFFYFPYIYSPHIFSHLTTREKFYEKMFKQAVKDNKIKMKDTEVIVCSFPDDMCSISSKYCTTLDAALETINGYKYVYIDRNKIIESGAARASVSYADQTRESESNLGQAEEINHFANLGIYPFVKPSNSSEQLGFDRVTRSQFNGLEVDPEIPIVFTGDRFNIVNDRWELVYLLMFDLISNPGFFELKIDSENKVASLALLNSYKPELFNSIHDYDYTSVGTLLNAPGGAEVLFETGMGTSQLAEVKSGDMFLIPLEENVQARVLVKNEVLGTLEKYISGGELGLVVDSRNKLNYEQFIKEYTEKELRLFETLIGSRVQGL